MSFFTSKVTPAPQKKVQEKEEGGNDENDTEAPVEIHVMSLWNIEDGEWFDRCGISIFMYTVASNNISVLRELLHKLSSSEPTMYKKRLRGEVPPKGIPSLGITGKITALVTAMGFAGLECVSLLLEHGADPYESDIAGNDALMLASIFGRTDNVKFWLKRFPNWDLERKNKVVGGVALGHAVYMGPHRLELVKVLLEHGASVDYRTDITNNDCTYCVYWADVDLVVLFCVRLRFSFFLKIQGE